MALHSPPGCLCPPKAALFSLTRLLYLCLLCLGFCMQDFYLVLRWVYTEIPRIPQRIVPFVVDLASYTFFIGLVWWRSHRGMLWILVSCVLDFISSFVLRLSFLWSAGLPHQGFSGIWPSGPAVAFLNKHFPSGNSGFVSSRVRPSSPCCVYATPCHRAQADGVVIWVWLKQLKWKLNVLIYA